jgi:hypothetical protein
MKSQPVVPVQEDIRSTVHLAALHNRKKITEIAALAAVIIYIRVTCVTLSR